MEGTNVESARNAELIAGTVNGFSSPGALVGAPADSPASIGFESLVMSTLMQSSSIFKLSLYDFDGSLLWTSGESPVLTGGPDTLIFARAVEGQTVTGLSKNVAFINSDGQIATGDLTSTYIPLVNQSTQKRPQILEVSREVTDVLGARVETAQGSILRALFPMMGASFAILLGVVVSADTMLHRSRRKALEQERAVVASQMAAETLELRNQQLQQIALERDKFLSMVSHELRTPLTSMLAFTEVLRRRQEGASRDANIDHLDLMRRNGDHLNTLIEELLEVTRIHTDHFEIVKDRFDLQELIDDVARTAAPLVRTRRQTLRITGSAANTRLDADRKRILQMMMNLVSNASLYSPEETAITVDAQKQGALVKVSVKDEGYGISEKDQKHLFEQFFRGNSEHTRSQSGLGLGLPIAMAIVDAHGGKLSLKSQAGSGTEVTVLIPTASESGAKSGSHFGVDETPAA